LKPVKENYGDKVKSILDVMNCFSKYYDLPSYPFIGIMLGLTSESLKK